MRHICSELCDHISFRETYGTETQVETESGNEDICAVKFVSLCISFLGAVSVKLPPPSAPPPPLPLTPP